MSGNFIKCQGQKTQTETLMYLNKTQTKLTEPFLLTLNQIRSI